MSVGRILKFAVMSVLFFSVGAFIVTRIPPLRAFIFPSA